MDHEPSRALLVVDMQNGFCHPDGSMPGIGRSLEGAGAAVRNAAVAVRQARGGGAPVIFTQLSLEVLTSYELAAVTAIGDGFDMGRPAPRVAAAAGSA